MKTPVGSVEFAETIRKWMVWLIHAADVRIPEANAKETQSGHVAGTVDMATVAAQRSRSQSRTPVAPSIVDAKVEEVKRGRKPGLMVLLLLR